MSLRHKYQGVSGRAATAAVRRRLKKKAEAFARSKRLHGDAKREQVKQALAARALRMLSNV